jgi:hypothetical protein
MKLPALLLAGSLAANAALVAVYFSRSPSSSPATPVADSAATVAPTGSDSAARSSPSKSAAPNPAVTAADPQTWARLQTSDLPGLAARLRAAGFPPDTIRAIISTQVIDRLRPKFLETIAQLETKPFWATDASYGGYDPKTLATFRELNRETNRLIKESLGPGFPEDTGDFAMYQRRRFGDLPREKTDQLQRIADDYEELRAQTTAAARGLMLPEDREKLALLEKEKRADLARILSPQELEDYLTRSSHTTNQLRTALTTFNASEAEFRAIFTARDAYEKKFGYQANGLIGIDLMKERPAAQAQVAEQLKATLGEARYAEYARASDREYQAISRIAQQANLPATAAVQAYDLRAQASKESNRIFSDTALSTDQKRAALQTLAQTTRTQLGVTLGADAGGTYLKVAEGWLSRIERGSAVTFTEGGGTSSRSLPPVRPTTPAPATKTNR